MRVINELQVFEIDGDATEYDGRPVIEFVNHPRSRSFVVLRVGEQELSVDGMEVIEAVKNALNVPRV